MTTYPALCPECSCPIQHLADNYGNRKGTIEDALEAHRLTVHPESTDVTE